MDRRPASEFYKLGGLFKEIELCSFNISNLKLYELISILIYSINDYTDSTIEENISPTSHFISLYSKLNNVAEEFPNDSVERELLITFKNKIKNIEDCIINYLSEKSIAFPDSEFLNAQFLIREPWNLFSNIQVLFDIPESIREDLLLFCQCYVYGIYTSAIIHILKATENYNIHFYEKISNQKIIKTMHWGILIRKTEIRLDELHPNNTGFKRLKESLEDLKKNNRIEIIHNNKMIYDEEEAYKIFEDCRIVISKMFYILKDRFQITQ